MTTPFNISRDRWSLREIIMDEGDRAGRGGFALVLDDEHFPYFRYPQSRVLADALNQAADGAEAPPVALGEGTPVQVRPTPQAVLVLSPAGATRALSIGEAKLLARDLLNPLAQTLTGQD